MKLKRDGTEPIEETAEVRRVIEIELLEHEIKVLEEIGELEKQIAVDGVRVVDEIYAVVTLDEPVETIGIVLISFVVSVELTAIDEVVVKVVVV